MRPNARDWELRPVPAELERRWVDEGHWSDRTLGQLLDAGLRAAPDTPVTIRSTVRPWRGTYRDVHDLARRVAGGLRAAGIGPGDVVAFQLPNWVEAAATFYGAAMVGAVVVPIVHFYGAKEVGYILRRTRVQALVTADRFGHLEFLANLDGLRAGLPDLETVWVVGDQPAGDLPAWAHPFDALAGGEPVDGPAAVDATLPALVAYTSGTTADPKGVIHSHRTIGFEIAQLGALQPDSRPNLIGAPVGHGIGMLAALLLPVHRREPIHLIDVWDPAAVLQAMVDDDLQAGTGATYFLISLLDHPEFADEHLKRMTHLGLGGSAVPLAVRERATELGISVVSMYGSTEHPSITGGTHDDPLDKRLHTDGHLLAGCEVRLVDDDGFDVPPGTPGEILSRGPECFMGYTDPSLNTCFDADGWYATGDVGVLDDDGYLTIVDRKKDIIIRGGENVSALEVEELLLRLPGVAEVAVVAKPHPRLGEIGSAHLRLVPGADPPTLAGVQAHLDAAGLARQKWPEDVRVVDDFPRTPSGKIQKYVLRQRLRDEASTTPPR